MSEKTVHIEKFRTFLKGAIKLSDDARVLIAVSGGLDSMTLAYLMHGEGFKADWAHCNFGLRGQESDGDEAFVKAEAEKFGVTCHTRHFDTNAYAANMGISTQMAARELRYEWFSSLLEKHQFDYLATAHHKNDHVETILFNQIKGTGIAGLHGILPINDKIIRPLLCFSRQELEEIADVHKIKWREDSSNSSDDYARNYLRHQVVPAMRNLNPSLEDTFQKNAQKIVQVEAMMDSFLESHQWRCNQKNKCLFIDLKGLEGAKYLPLLIHQWIKPYGFSYDQAEQIEQCIGGQPGKEFRSSKYLLIVDRNQLVISELVEQKVGYALGIEGPGQYSWGEFEISILVDECDQITINRNPEVLQADAERISWPLEIRNWEAGDAFVPLGMKGKKKVSDLMIDLKIPVNLKKQVKIVCDQKGIIWMAGYRMAERVKLTSTTRKLLTISYIKS